jgi:hypothetical protein
MSESLFNRLYSYRQREGKNNRENFLIELLGYALQKDENFRLAFLSLIHLGLNEEYFKVSTQSVYDKSGRPDLEIQIGIETIILIECKVESGESKNQLENYKSILNEKRAKNKHLIYLTKYYENKGNGIVHLRWYQIIDLLKELDRSEILNEFLKYLKEEGMETKDFDLSDLTSLNQMHSVMSKMDEVLDRSLISFQKIFGGKAETGASRSTKMQKNRWYGDLKRLKGKDNYVIQGFKASGKSGLPEVFLEIALKKSNILTEGHVKQLAITLGLDFLAHDGGKWFWLGKYQTLPHWVGDQGVHEGAHMFLKNILNEIERNKDKWVPTLL